MKYNYKTAFIIATIFTIVVSLTYMVINNGRKTASSLISTSDNSLNIYIWSEYLTNDMIKQFTKETGIKINLTNYDNNETMFTKLKTLKNSGYDIVVPSSYYVERMVKHDMLQKLDKSKLTNLHNINPFFLDKRFDLKNRYSVPYLWGSTGIIINNKYIKKKIDSWQDFWEPEYKNQLLLFNDMRDVFSMALLSLGYSADDSDPKHIEAAYLKLKALRPNIKIFSIETIPSIYIDEDAYIGMIWSGDYGLAKAENPNLDYIYPKEGFTVWIDSFVIIKDAPHIENAHKFINFILRPEIAKQATVAFGYASANQEVIKLMPLKWQQDPINNPNISIIRQGKILCDLDDEVRKLYEKYWEKLKLGD